MVIGYGLLTLFGGIDFVYEKYAGISKEILNFLPEITFANPPKKC